MTNIKISKSEIDTHINKRERYVNNVKSEMKFFNFGLPPSQKYAMLEWEEASKKFKSLRELWVRLNVYEANGEIQHGIIQYPEANRIIDYHFDDNNVNRSYVRFRSTRNTINK